MPYLRAVDDKDEQSPYQNWTVSVTNESLSRYIKNSYSDIGTVKEIDFSGLKKDPAKASKPQVIKFIGSNKKSVELTKTQLRSLLNLKSSNFTIELEDNKKAKNDILKIDKDDKKLIFKGSGFGHRLGMSQWGAKSLADKGKNYQQILYHYYSDVNIKDMYK